MTIKSLESGGIYILIGKKRTSLFEVRDYHLSMSADNKTIMIRTPHTFYYAVNLYDGNITYNNGSEILCRLKDIIYIGNTKKNPEYIMYNK